MKDPIQRFFATGQVSLMQARLDAVDADGNPKLLAMGVRDKPAGAGFDRPRPRFGGPGGFSFNTTRNIADSPVYVRGEPDHPGETRVPRGTLTVLAKEPLRIGRRTSGRAGAGRVDRQQGQPAHARAGEPRVAAPVRPRPGADRR
ncbi:MAG: hypothetical protein U0736_11185 [Gemmataceae bacterium]